MYLETGRNGEIMKPDYLIGFGSNPDRGTRVRTPCGVRAS